MAVAGYRHVRQGVVGHRTNGPVGSSNPGAPKTVQNAVGMFNATSLNREFVFMDEFPRNQQATKLFLPNNTKQTRLTVPSLVSAIQFLPFQLTVLFVEIAGFWRLSGDFCALGLRVQRRCAVFC